MADFKIGISDCDHANTDIEAKVIKDGGFEMELFQCKTEDDLINNCKGMNALINQYVNFSEKVFLGLPDLKLIVRYGVGYNNVDLKAATKHGVQVCNVPDYGMNEVADQALSLMLALTRKIVINDKRTREGIWDYSLSIPIRRHSTLTVGIVGMGRIGTEFAKRVRALGANIIAAEVDEKKPVPEFVKVVSFDELLRESDVISVHCPADNNINLFDEKEFKKMKNTAYLINVSRGGIVKEVALDKALENREIAGAAIDVVMQEPIDKNSPLFRHDNFICTPHMAWYSEESALELKRKVAEEAVRFAKGEKILYPVNSL